MTKYIYPAKAKPSKINWFAKFLGISALVGSLGIGSLSLLSELDNYMIKNRLEQEKIKKEKTLENFLNFSFIVPFEIQIREENQEFVAYVFDAGDRTIHRFSQEGHVKGQYLPPNTAPINAVDIYEKYFVDRKNKKYASFIIEEGKVQVDNLDGTIIKYKLPNLMFSQRIQDANLQRFEYCDIQDDLWEGITNEELGEKIIKRNKYEQERNKNRRTREYRVVGNFYSDVLEECYLPDRFQVPDNVYNIIEKLEAMQKKWLERSIPYYVAERILIENPTYYTLFNDAPSRSPVTFTALFSSPNFGFKMEGRCNLATVIGFVNNEKRILLGSMCNRGDVEQYYSIPYAQAGIADSLTPPTFFSAVLYKDAIYFIKKGNKKVHKVQILSANQK